MFRYCNSHLQVLGLVPKKTRRKKASESQDSIDKDSSPHTTRDAFQHRADVPIPDHQKMAFTSPVVQQHRSKKRRKQQKKDPDIPAIVELKECLTRSKRDRQNLFESYGKNSLDLTLGVLYFSNFFHEVLTNTLCLHNTSANFYKLTYNFHDFIAYATK